MHGHQWFRAIASAQTCTCCCGPPVLTSLLQVSQLQSRPLSTVPSSEPHQVCADAIHAFSSFCFFGLLRILSVLSHVLVLRQAWFASLVNCFELQHPALTPNSFEITCPSFLRSLCPCGTYSTQYAHKHNARCCSFHVLLISRLRSYGVSRISNHTSPGTSAASGPAQLEAELRHIASSH
eukprot:6186203-Pleurochrysis_carterae.AAC.2